MFGYVRIRKSELRVREYEYYRAAYCGLCRSMGKCTGQCSRLTLSYDVAFLVHVRMLLCGTVPTFKRRRCLAHPLKKRPMMEANDQLSYGADISALLAYEKCRDDIADEGFWGRCKARMRCLFLSGAYKRARKRLPEAAVAVREHLAALSRLERERPASVDAPAAVFGELLADVVAFGLPDTAVRVARVIGDKVGRFIYIADAIDDLEKDAKRGNFNPVLALFGEKPTCEERESIRVALIACLSDLEAALDLTEEHPRPEIKAVIENILYFGMPDTVRRVLCGKTGCKEDNSGEQ